MVLTEKKENYDLESNWFEDFNERLLLAISQYMEAYELAGLHWTVCGINLRFAIERELYFKFIVRLEYFYSAYMSTEPQDIRNRFQSDVFKLLIGGKYSLVDTYPPENHKIIQSQIKSYFPTPGRILLNIVAPKFLSYMEPIVAQLDCEVHILCNDRHPDLVRQVKNTGLPYSVMENEMGEASIGGFYSSTMSARLLSSLVDNVVKIRPEKIITVEGCHLEDQLLCELGNLLGVKTLCIQYGYAHFYPLTVRNMCYHRFFTWGPYFKEGLEKFNPDSHFTSVGHHKLAKPNSAGKSDSQHNAQLSVGFLLQGVKYYITQKHFDDFIDFVCIVAKQYPGLKRFVREHPSNPITEEDRQKIGASGAEFLDSAECSITDFLDACDVVISISASSLVEALAVGVIPVYVNLPLISAFNRLRKKNESVFIANSLDEAYFIVNRLFVDREYFLAARDAVEKNNRYMYTALGNEALGNIIEEVNCA